MKVVNQLVLSAAVLAVLSSQTAFANSTAIYSHQECTEEREQGPEGSTYTKQCTSTKVTTKLEAPPEAKICTEETMTTVSAPNSSDARTRMKNRSGCQEFRLPQEVIGAIGVLPVPTAKASGFIAVADGGSTASALLAADGGVTLTAGAIALGTAYAMNEVVYSDCIDQQACEAAQTGTYIGAAVGTTAAVVAAPVVAVVAAGGLTYWLFSGD